MATTLQIAIQKFENGGDPLYKKEYIISYLKPLLPSEEIIIRDAWKAALDYAAYNEIVLVGAMNKPPDESEYITNLKQ